MTGEKKHMEMTNEELLKQVTDILNETKKSLNEKIGMSHDVLNERISEMKNDFMKNFEGLFNANRNYLERISKHTQDIENLKMNIASYEIKMSNSVKEICQSNQAVESNLRKSIADAIATEKKEREDSIKTCKEFCDLKNQHIKDKVKIYLYAAVGAIILGIVAAAGSIYDFVRGIK